MRWLQRQSARWGTPRLHFATIIPEMITPAEEPIRPCFHGSLGSLFRFLACGVLLASAVTLRAQQTTFDLDPAKTTVEFTLGATLHSVNGTFKAKSGKISFDAASGEATGSFVIDATSGNSGIGLRDHKMHEEVLESGKYPEIVFTPARVMGAVSVQGDSTVQVRGMFRLHGTDHEVTFSIPVHLSGNEVTAQIHFVVPYVAWGLKNPSTFVLRVSKEVEIDVSARGKLAPSASDSSLPSPGTPQ
jgi:polyisoprenoid-binding protein YceI